MRGKVTQFDKVTAIREFFSAANDFVYDTGVGPAPRTSPASCAPGTGSASSTPPRSAGCCARRGSRPGSRSASPAASNAAATTTLTNHDLHAWTEVYFPGFGWLPFDATPPAAISGSASTSYVPGPAVPAEPDDQHRGGPAPGPTGTITEPGPGPTNPGAVGPGRPGTTAGQSTVERLLSVAGPWALGGTLALLLLLSPAAARRRVRRSRLARASTGTAEDSARSHAHHAWDELIDTMLDYRLPVHDTETPRATVERLVVEGRLHDRARDGVRLLNDVEEHARYARRPLAAQELRAALGAVRTDLAGHAPAATRVRAVLLPPSVLRRWQTRLRGGRPPRVAQAHDGRPGNRAEAVS